MWGSSNLLQDSLGKNVSEDNLTGFELLNILLKTLVRKISRKMKMNYRIED